PQLQRQAHRKLLILNRAADLSDLRVPPGNRLEKLVGDRSGQYSIRINSQFRLVFNWSSAGPENVKITDYQLRSLSCPTLCMTLFILAKSFLRSSSTRWVSASTHLPKPSTFLLAASMRSFMGNVASLQTPACGCPVL